MRVGLVATFARWKGHHVFLEAIARLPPSLNVRAYVIGGAVYETGNSQVSIEELRQASARLGLTDRVGFTGVVEDPAPAIRALDVVVHASTEPEPFGLVIAEAMACGRALVMSPGGGAAELVTPGVDALACAPGDAGALARSIEHLAADAGLRQRLGQAARAAAERRFARRRLANELREVYESIAPHAAPGVLRVLHVHSGNLYGGVETFLATLARERAAAPRMTSSFALCFEGRLSSELRGARSCAAAPGCRAIEPPAHRLAGASIARPASRSAQRRRRRLSSGMAVRDLRPGDPARRGCRWCSGCTLPATAGTGSSGGRGA